MVTPAIAILLVSGELRSELATNALLDIQEHFNIEKTSTLYRQLFWQLIEEKEKKVHKKKTQKKDVDIEDEYSENGEPSNKQLRELAEEAYYQYREQDKKRREEIMRQREEKLREENMRKQEEKRRKENTQKQKKTRKLQKKQK